MTETAWVIQRDDGKYVYIRDDFEIEFVDSLLFAYKFYELETYSLSAYEMAIEYITRKNLQNCKPVKCEIRIIGDEK